MNEVWQNRMELEERNNPLIKLLRNRDRGFTVFGRYSQEETYFLAEFDENGDSTTFRRFVDDHEADEVHAFDAIVNSDGHFLVLIGYEFMGFDCEWRIREYDQNYNLVEDHFLFRPRRGLHLTHLVEIDEGGYFVVGYAVPILEDEDRENDFNLRILVNSNENFHVTSWRYLGRDLNMHTDGICKLHHNKYGFWGGRNDEFFVSLLDSVGNVYPDSLFFEERIYQKGISGYGEENFIYAFEYTLSRRDSLRGAKVITLYDSELDSVESLFWLRENHRNYFQFITSCSDGGVLISTQKDTTIRWRDLSFDHLIKIAPSGWEPNKIESKKPEIADRFGLFNIYPNPFNSNTTISYNLPLPGNVTFNIFDHSGRSIEQVKRGWQHRGEYRLNWDASNYPAGVYLVSMKYEGGSMKTRKMVLVR